MTKLDFQFELLDYFQGKTCHATVSFLQYTTVIELM